MCCAATQVLDNSLEARVLQSDNSALAKDCRREMKDLNRRLLKLGELLDRMPALWLQRLSM